MFPLSKIKSILFHGSPRAQDLKKSQKGMWNGDHLIKVEEYELAKKNKKTLHIREL